MRPWTPPTLQSSKVPTHQDPLCNLKAFKCLGTLLAYVGS